MMNNQNILQSDIVVVGGGHAGLLQTLLLAQNGLKTICIDQQDPQLLQDPDFDGRTTAVSFGSHRLMKAAEIWDQLKPYACPIDDIQILDGNSPVLLDFHAQDMGEETGTDEAKFGWIIENFRLHRILHQALAEQPNATHITKTRVINYKVNNDHAHVILDNEQTIQTSLVIGADGRGSFTREWMGVGVKEWSYDQSAIVCVITHENPHQYIAVEHFKSGGPLAILPMLDDAKGRYRSAVVWTQEGSQAKKVLNFKEHVFLTALNNIIPDFYGNVIKIGKRYIYPLGFVHAYDYIKPRMALIADAAHGIHPIAGQGLNLGLRDVAALSDILINAHKDNKDIGSLDVLEKYQTLRRPDNMAMAATTDMLNRLFSNNKKSVALGRKIGLQLVSRFTPAKKFFMRQAMGAAGNLPKIIRQGKI